MTALPDGLAEYFARGQARRKARAAKTMTEQSGNDVTAEQGRSSSGETTRPITDDFYRAPNGEWVYRWSDERLVLKRGPSDVSQPCARGSGKTTEANRSLRESIERGEHAHSLAVGKPTRCWNGDPRCPAWRKQGGDLPDSIEVY